MEHKKRSTEYKIDIEDIPASVLVQREIKDRYGQVEGLDVDELADPGELERQVYRQMMEPIMRLPARFKSYGPRPEIDEQGDLEWGAFGSIDFIRDRPAFMDKSRYKLDILKEELKDQVIAISMIRPHLKGSSYALILKYLEMDIISMDDVTDFWMKRMAMRYFKAKRLKDEIRQLRELLNTRAPP